MASTGRGKQSGTRGYLQPPVTWCQRTCGRVCKNTQHTACVCFLPSQQKMAQKIMKMIQGDYIEKPDFALKSIGKQLPLTAPTLQSTCLRFLKNSSVGGFQFWSGVLSAPGKFMLRANRPPPQMTFFAAIFCFLCQSKDWPYKTPTQAQLWLGISVAENRSRGLGWEGLGRGLCGRVFELRHGEEGKVLQTQGNPRERAPCEGHSRSGGGGTWKEERWGQHPLLRPRGTWGRRPEA